MLPCLTMADHGLTMGIIKVDQVNSWSAVKYHTFRLGMVLCTIETLEVIRNKCRAYTGFGLLSVAILS